MTDLSWYEKLLKEHDDAIDLLCRTSEHELPVDWDLQLLFQQGELEINLIDPWGNLVEFTDDDCELTAAQMIVRRVDFARRADGLQPWIGGDDSDCERVKT